MKSRILITGIFVFVVSIPSISRAVESHPGLDVEATYSEAVLAFNKKQNAEAVRILTDLLKTSPNHVESLELMALSLKSMGDDKKSIDVYSRLVKLKPPNERGPYHFEIGVVLNRQKKQDLARTHFEASLALKFNEIACHMFLGLITFNAGDYNPSRKHFTEVKSGGPDDLKVVARYYLGLIHFKNGYSAGGTYELLEARSIAEEMPGSKMASDIKKAADKVLEPFGSAQNFGNLTLLGQYDTNISQVPAGTASTQTSGKSTGNVSLSGGIGRMSSPLKMFQWVGSYRFSGNKTTDSATQSYQYFSNMPSLYINYRPLARTSGGVKLAGNFTFKSEADDPTDSQSKYVFRKYSFTGEVGPFLRYEADQTFQITAETSYKSQKNYSDSSLSGPILATKLSIKTNLGSRFLNPGGSISYESSRVSGSDYKYNSIGAGAYNSIKLSSKNSLTLSLDYLSSKYPSSSVGRSDTNLIARTSFVHSFSTRWSLLTDLTYTKNNSNIPESYSYNRAQIGAGIGWSL